MDKLKKKLMIIDDDTDFLEMLKSALELSNYEVETAMDGKTALKIGPTIM